MTPEQKLGTATVYLDTMLSSLKADLAANGGPLSARHVEAMAAGLLEVGAEPEWIDALMWMLAIAQVRLAGGVIV